jgi:flagellum-specific peptidoglycan hydrolase FlgJ
MSLTPEQTGALATIADAAVRSEQQTGLPAELTAAQCIFESAWLTKAPGNNCFGLKAYNGAYGTQLLATTEWFTQEQAAAFMAQGAGRTAKLRPNVAPSPSGRRLYDCLDVFATFADLGECFTYHANLIVNGARYAAAWAQYQTDGNLNALCLNVGKVYATDPTYGQKISDEAHSAALTYALNAARGGNGLA